MQQQQDQPNNNSSTTIIRKKTVSFLDILKGTNNNNTNEEEQHTKNNNDEEKKNQINDDDDSFDDELSNNNNISSSSSSSIVVRSKSSSPSSFSDNSSSTNYKSNDNISAAHRGSNKNASRSFLLIHLFPDNNNNNNSKNHLLALVGADAAGVLRFPSSSSALFYKNSYGVDEYESSESFIKQEGSLKMRNCINYSFEEKEGFSPKTNNKIIFAALQQNTNNTSSGPTKNISPFTFLQQLNFAFNNTHVPLTMTKDMCDFVSFQFVSVVDDKKRDDKDEQETFSFSPEFTQAVLASFVSSLPTSTTSPSSVLMSEIRQQYFNKEQEVIVRYSLNPPTLTRRLQSAERCSLCGKSASPMTMMMCSDQHQKLSLGEVKSVFHGHDGQVFISIRSLDDRWLEKEENPESNSNKNLFSISIASTMAVGGFEFWKKFVVPDHHQRSNNKNSCNSTFSRPPRLVYFIPHIDESKDEYFAMIRSVDVPQGVYNRFFSQLAKNRQQQVQQQQVHQNTRRGKNFHHQQQHRYQYHQNSSSHQQQQHQQQHRYPYHQNSSSHQQPTSASAVVVDFASFRYVPGQSQH